MTDYNGFELMEPKAQDVVYHQQVMRAYYSQNE